MLQLVLDPQQFPTYAKWFEATAHQIAEEIVDACIRENLGDVDYEKAQEMLNQRVAQYVGWPVERQTLAGFFVLSFRDDQDQEMLAIRLMLN